MKKINKEGQDLYFGLLAAFWPLNGLKSLPRTWNIVTDSFIVKGGLDSSDLTVEKPAPFCEFFGQP